VGLADKMLLLPSAIAIAEVVAVLIDEGVILLPVTSSDDDLVKSLELEVTSTGPGVDKGILMLV